MTLGTELGNDAWHVQDNLELHYRETVTGDTWTDLAVSRPITLQGSMVDGGQEWIELSVQFKAPDGPAVDGAWAVTLAPVVRISEDTRPDGFRTLPTEQLDNPNTMSVGLLPVLSLRWSLERRALDPLGGTRQTEPDVGTVSLRDLVLNSPA